jgi:hypothetical protein
MDAGGQLDVLSQVIDAADDSFMERASQGTPLHVKQLHRPIF